MKKLEFETELKPTEGEKVIWKGWNVVIKKIKVRSKIAKVVPDYQKEPTMPYQYFWVSFNEIGF